MTRPDSSSNVLFVDKDKFFSQMGNLSSTHQIITRLAIEHLLAIEGLSLAQTSWLKSLGSGLWELRIGPSTNSVLKKVADAPIPKTAESKILVRVFVSFKENEIILISCFDKLRHGGGKRHDKAIGNARSMLLQYLGRR